MSFLDNFRNEPEEPSYPRMVPVAYNAPRPIVASAAVVDLKNKKEVDAIGKRRQSNQWQEEAWEYYDLIGEIKYSANLVANVMSRINLYAAFIDDSASIPTKINKVHGLDESFVREASDLVYRLESGDGGSSALLRDAALNMFVVGECWLVNEPGRISVGEPDKWRIRSVNEIVNIQGRRKSAVAIKSSRDAKPADFIELPDRTYISRIWKRHPRYSAEADSSMRGLLDICDELLLLGRSARATAKSRLNAGMLFMPDELSNISQSDGNFTDDPDVAELADDMSDNFEEELMDAMTTPIADESSASAVVPLIVRGPKELADAIKFIKFERAFDPQLAARSEKIIERILAGLDLPKDVAAGMTNVKYANAIVIEEQLYKAHVEPMVLSVVDCLTIGFLRPWLRFAGYPEHLVQRAVIWYDPSAITAKPSKAEAAVTLFNANAISEEALRRANGFSGADAATNEEKLQKMALAQGLVDDQTQQLIIKSLLPEEWEKKFRQQALANTDPASAQALDQALTPGTAPAPAPSPQPQASDTIGQTPTPATGDETPPSELMEP